MSEDEEVSRSKSQRLSRRALMRLGLLAIPATQVPLAFVHEAAARGTKLGANLIGKLEGGEVVTDPALFPKSFKEAPQLAELVKAGKLPPVQERIGQDPLVVKPLREIGRYGGTWRRGFTGPFDTSNGHRAAQNDKLLYWDYTGTKLVPNIAKAWEVSPDGKITTLLLRRGMKWSDGQPFTADDFVFWYQDVYQNKDLVPTPLSVMTIGGKPIAIEKVDATTILFVSPEPYYALPTVLASVWGIGHHARWGRSALGGFAPAHYLKQFHPKYASKEDLAKKVAELNFDGWVTMFKNRNDACRNVDLPVVTPWKTTTPLTTPTWILERNPYSVWVDTDGNQLPYIDRIRMTLGENLEVINLRAIAGEYDSQARHIDISKLPVLLENQQKGRYRVYLDPSDQGADVGLFCNQSYDKDPEIAKWLSTREFRIALSHGIDRAQIAEMMAEQWKKIGIRGEIQEMERGAATARVQTNEHQIYFETQWGADNIYGHFPFVFPDNSGSPMGPLYGLWYASAGASGKTPPARMRELMDKYRKSFSVKDQERTKMAKEVWKIALDEMWTIPIVSNSPASQGVRVIKTNMGNIPERLWNSAVSDNPHIAHTETWYFKS